ncbi:MAG: hypothetical protein WB696_18075 [Chthoniobacterales bacterium]
MSNRPNFSRREALSLLGLTAATLVARPAFAAPAGTVDTGVSGEARS